LTIGAPVAHAPPAQDEDRRRVKCPCAPIPGRSRLRPLPRSCSCSSRSVVPSASELGWTSTPQRLDDAVGLIATVPPRAMASLRNIAAALRRNGRDATGVLSLLGITSS
jgi:hypothetical protein